VTPAQDQIHIVLSGETHLDFTAKPNGHDTPVAGNPGFNQVELRRVDRKTSQVTQKKDGAIVATVLAKVSSGGKELTITRSRPGHADQIEVWTRTGGEKVANDPLAGEWTQDLSKTRMRQGSVLKISSDSSGGVRFSGDDSYTARFDGKPYDVQNSHNDSVTLALADAHTVDAIYRRDQQISQRDKWVVSADGQQMTLTSTGSLETGQHFTETLVFKKQ
jgi:hypothetical protein